MRIRTATAAAVLATAALLGSAGTTFASSGDHLSHNNSHNKVNWTERATDFSEAILSGNTSRSDNDSVHSQDWRVTNISDNFVGNFNGGFRMGDFEMED